jgi:hypothetical protein
LAFELENIETQRRREEFLGNKWLKINEEIQYKGTISCNKITELKKIGKYLYELKRKGEKGVTNHCARSRRNENGGIAIIYI